MLEYGALAQLYVDPAAEDLANRYLTNDQRALLKNYPW